MFIDNDTRGMTGNDGEKGERVRKGLNCISITLDPIKNHPVKIFFVCFSAFWSLKVQSHLLLLEQYFLDEIQSIVIHMIWSYIATLKWSWNLSSKYTFLHKKKFAFVIFH